MSRHSFVAGGGAAVGAALVIPAPAFAAPTPSATRPAISMLSTDSIVFDSTFTAALPLVDVMGAEVSGLSVDTVAGSDEVELTTFARAVFRQLQLLGDFSW